MISDERWKAVPFVLMAHTSTPNRRRGRSWKRIFLNARLKARSARQNSGWRFPESGNRGLRRFFGWLTAAALLCAAGFAVLVLTRNFIDDSNPGKKILELTSQDIDPETTLVEKNLLRQGQIDARLAIALLPGARQQLSGDALQQAERALQDNRMVKSLEPLAKQWSNDFDTGKAAAFVIWISEDESQKGRGVELLLNGVPLGHFAIESSRSAITLVERSEFASRLEIRGVSDSDGGVVFRAETATSQAETRHLSKGKSDFWQIMVR
jgi:hypothetical protein